MHFLNSISIQFNWRKIWVNPLPDSMMIPLTHWGRVTHICVSKLTIIGSDNGLSPGRRQAIIWTNAGILLIWPLVTNFNEIPTEIYIFSFKKMHLKMSSAKWRPFCIGLNVLIKAYMRHHHPVVNGVFWCFFVSFSQICYVMFDMLHLKVYILIHVMSYCGVLLARS